MIKRSKEKHLKNLFHVDINLTINECQEAILWCINNNITGWKTTGARYKFFKSFHNNELGEFCYIYSNYLHDAMRNDDYRLNKFKPTGLKSNIKERYRFYFHNSEDALFFKISI